MNKLLEEFKEKKKDKVRRGRDLEEEIARSLNQIDASHVFIQLGRRETRYVHVNNVNMDVQLFLYSQGQDTFWNTFNSKGNEEDMSGTINSGNERESGGRRNGSNRGANYIGTSQSSRPSSRDINPVMSDHNGRSSQEYEEKTIAYTYCHLRKANVKAIKAPPTYEN
ncbi:hypothetical protein Cgig2_009122 [Carnegiea gigantea]|uniref:Uncharacterized protein n=1 Tax=Carnegiea gigantea TaxID=171969 RepID=A0A9Q1GNN8_9CARY|nr:hypothetical protein Cgig2_009122 [Carnegiea gigantea]